MKSNRFFFFLKRPHPKSLSQKERDFPSLLPMSVERHTNIALAGEISDLENRSTNLPFSLWEKASGDEGIVTIGQFLIAEFHFITKKESRAVTIVL